MPAAAQLVDYRSAARAAAAGSRSFSLAARFLPPEMRRGAHAVYWFCRFTDDLVDEPDPPVDLDTWERWLASALDGGDPVHPALATFADAARRFSIPREYPFELIRGMRMDLDHRGYETFDDLRLFCYRVASVVGLMMCHVIGFRRDALRYAEELGVAMQLTNILRDVGEDLGAGRVYLPREELRRFGCSGHTLRARALTPQFRELMRFQIGRARERYRAARPGIALLDGRGRIAVAAAASLYEGILDRIEGNDYEVFHRRAVVSPAEKLKMVSVTIFRGWK